MDQERSRKGQTGTLLPNHKAMAAKTKAQQQVRNVLPQDLGIGRLFEKVHDAVILANAETQRIVLWNPMAERMFGYPASEALGLRVEELVPERLKARHRKGIARYADSGRGSYIASEKPLRLPAIRKNGEEIRIELSLSPVDSVQDTGDGGPFVLAIIRDVTERERAEEERSRLAALVEASHNAIIGKTLDGIITSWNRGAEDIHGYLAEEALGQPISILVPPDRSDEVSCILQKVRSGEKLDHYETERVRKDGRRIHVSLTVSPVRDSEGNIVGAATIARDITQRKRIEKVLKESEQRFQALVQNALDIVMVTDADGTIRYISPSVNRILGYKVEDMIGTNTAEYVHPDDSSSAFEELEAALSKPGAHPVAVETRVRHKDGSWRHLEGIANNLLDDPAVRGLVFNHRDVTDRVRAEEEVRRLNETLERQVAERTVTLAERERQLEKLVSKLVTAQEEERRRVAREMHDGLTQVAIAAHQHLQAFAAIQPPSSVAGRRELDRSLMLARQTVKEARLVIEGLRPTALDDFGLAIALRLLVEEFRDDGWEIGYEETLGQDRPPAEIETALYRITQEALTNAHKHARTAWARVLLARQESSVCLEVRDYGCGFNPSAVCPPHVPGEGMGLSGMHERITLLGGKLTIRSQPGAGTSVIAEVPLPPSEAMGDEHEG